MYHLQFRGTHKDIDHRWGTMLKKRHVDLLMNVPFPITKERLDFALQCLPLYEQHFPEILQEIRGIAAGQQCDPEKLMAVLFSMYCIMPAAHCSTFAVRSLGGGVLLGRNSDFLTGIEKLYMNTLYRFSTDSYAFNGNTTAFIEMEDGINSQSLAVGLTSVAPSDIKPGLNAGMLLRLFLEKCQTVQDLLSGKKGLSLPIRPQDRQRHRLVRHLYPCQYEHLSR